MELVLEKPRPTGEVCLTCSEGHRFGLPLVYLENTLFLHYFNSARVRLACPVCWTGGGRFQLLESLTRKPVKLTLLPVGTRFDWVHRGQHYGCASCEYALRTG